MCSREFSGQKVVHHWPWLLSVDAERASRIVKNLCDISSTMNAWTSSYIPGFLRFGESFIMAITLQTTSPRNMNNLSLTVFLSIKSNQTDFKHEKSLTVRKGVIRRRSPFWGLRFITVCRLSLCSSEDINIMDIPLSVRKTFRRPLFSNLVQVVESICTKLIYFCYVYSIFVLWRYVLQKLRLFYFQWN